MLHHARKISVASIVALLALLALLPVASAAPHMAETKTVAMQNLVFEPKTITVNAGDTITWTNQDQVPHTVTAADGSFDSGNIDAGQTFSHTFTTAGTVAYYCKYHGAAGGSGMAGTITVQEAAAQPQPTAAQSGSAAPTGSIEVSDQPVKDGTITVAKATISQDGWIVVHKAGPDGKLLLTPPVGMTQIKAGDNMNVAIKLSEDVAAGAPLWPMLHIDAGVKGTYEFPNGPDVPVAANGMPVMKQITVQAANAAQPVPAQGAALTGSIEVSNQAVQNGAITVAKATISQDGWIVVHKAGPDGKLLLTPPVGMTQIKAGDNTNVQIKLTEPVAVGAPLWPMLHIDAGVKGTYEFPNGPDVPVAANGMPVMKQIAVQAAGGPAQLPNTGGSETPVTALALGALVLLVGGALISRQILRRGA